MRNDYHTNTIHAEPTVNYKGERKGQIFLGLDEKEEKIVEFDKSSPCLFHSHEECMRVIHRIYELDTEKQYRAIVPSFWI